MKIFLWAALLLSIVINANAQKTPSNPPPTGDVNITVSVEPQPLSIAIVGDMKFNNLMPGVAYRAFAVDEGSYPNIFPNKNFEKFEPAQIEVGGAPNSSILLTFILPTKLYATSAENIYVQMIYDNTCGGVVNKKTGSVQFFHPQNGVTLSLPSDGSNALVYLSANPIIPYNAIQDDYIGYGLITAAYTGTSL